MMLQHDRPDDYVLATGQAKTVREFVIRAFAHIGVKLNWSGQGVDEIATNAKTGKTVLCVDAKFFRPKDVDYLLGDATKAQKTLGWKPDVYFDDLISEMINSDRALLHNKSNIGTSWSQTA